MTAQETNVTNAYESTLSSSLAQSATTINVTSTTGAPAVPFYVVIEPGTDAKREVVLVDSSKTATTFVLSAASKRGQDGTSDVAHDSGVKIAIVPVAALWTDINDRVDGVDPITTRGDIIRGSSAGVAERLAVGTVNQFVGTDGTDVAWEQPDHGSLAGLADFTADHGTEHDSHDHSTALGTATAADLPNVAAGNIVATDVQAAINELDTEKIDGTQHDARDHSTALGTGALTDLGDVADTPATTGYVLTRQAGGTYDFEAAAGAIGDLSDFTNVIKSASESVTSSQVLQNDDELLFAIGTAGTWTFEIAVLVGTGAEAADIVIDMTVPAGATGKWSVLGLPAATTDPLSASIYNFANLSYATGGIILGIDDTRSTWMLIKGHVVAGGTAGNVQFKWAQGSSSGTSTTVLAGSQLEAKRVA